MDSLDSDVRRAGPTWWPHMRLCAAIMTAFIPEAHTLLMVVAGVPRAKPEKPQGGPLAQTEESSQNIWQNRPFIRTGPFICLLLVYQHIKGPFSTRQQV